MVCPCRLEWISATGAPLQHEYRGHRIQLVHTEQWLGRLVELASGTMLPTQVVGRPEESFREVWLRARDLVDKYLDAMPEGTRVLGPVRPWQTIRQ